MSRESSMVTAGGSEGRAGINKFEEATGGLDDLGRTASAFVKF